jgi:hypothetical protein
VTTSTQHRLLGAEDMGDDGLKGLEVNDVVHTIYPFLACWERTVAGPIPLISVFPSLVYLLYCLTVLPSRAFFSRCLMYRTNCPFHNH